MRNRNRYSIKELSYASIYFLAFGLIFISMILTFIDTSSWVGIVTFLGSTVLLFNGIFILKKSNIESKWFIISTFVGLILVIIMFFFSPTFEDIKKYSDFSEGYGLRAIVEAVLLFAGVTMGLFIETSKVIQVTS